MTGSAPPPPNSVTLLQAAQSAPAAPLVRPNDQAIHDLAFVHIHTVPMMFLPDAWRAAQNSARTWVGLTFPPEPRSDVPTNPGVYVFVVMPSIFDFVHSSGLFYVGKATNLYSRIGAYLSEKTKPLHVSTRPHIWRMINQWEGYLKYFYTITATVEEAEALETQMLNAFRPHFNRQYEGTLSQTMRAF